MELKSNLEYAFFRGTLAILGLLPYRWATRIMRGAARLAGPIAGMRRDVVRSQLHAVYPDLTGEGVAGMTARVYDHLGLTAAEVFFAETGDLNESVDIVPGWDDLDRALSQGRGAIIATGHIGNFELGGRVLAQRFPLLDVVKTQRNAPFDRFLQDQRLRFGIRTVPVQRSGRAVLEHLKGGGLVTLLVDQDAGKIGYVSDFLGLPASTWPGAAKLSIRTGCPVIPVAILRNDDHTHTLHIGEALLPRGLTDTEVDVREFSGRISAAVEQFIWDRPEQWFWVHRRWKGAAEARGANESSTKV